MKTNIMHPQASATRLRPLALCGWIVLTLCTLMLINGCRKTSQQTKLTASATTDVSDGAAPMGSMQPPTDAPASDDGRSAIDRRLPKAVTDLQTRDAADEQSTEPATPPIEETVDPCTQEIGIAMADGSPQPAIPILTKRVTDLTGWLSDECTASLTARLAALEHDTGAQIAVLLTNETDGDDIDRYANRVFSQWKLGRKGVDDGVLFIADIQHHHARIEVGYGLEGTLPDAVAGDILRNDLQPNFRDERYNAGVGAVVDDLVKRVRAGGLPKPQLQQRHSTGLAFVLAMLALSIVLGGTAEALHLRWPLRLLLPPTIAALCVLVAVPLHLTPGYGTIIPMIPISVGASLIGIPFVNSTKQSLQWLQSWLATSVLLCVVVAIVGRTKGMPFSDLSGWFFAAAAAGFCLGSIVFLLVKIFSGSRGHRSGWSSPQTRDSDDSSSSSPDSSSNSSSSSPDSGSFSGGGGESGGGGASTSW